jgi:hypothetical protein
MTTFNLFLYFRWKSVHMVSQQLLAQLTYIHEICCEHNACEDPLPPRVFNFNLLPPIVLTQLPCNERKSRATAFGYEIL